MDKAICYAIWQLTIYGDARAAAEELCVVQPHMRGRGQSSSGPETHMLDAPPARQFERPKQEMLRSFAMRENGLVPVHDLSALMCHIGESADPHHLAMAMLAYPDIVDCVLRAPSVFC